MSDRVTGDGHREGVQTMSKEQRRKFILFCHARTGSSLMGALLDSHPDLFWDGESFKPSKRWRRLGRAVGWPQRAYPLPFLELRALRHRSSTYGCKIAPYYVTDPKQLIARAHQHRWSIVHLWRRDIFHSALSQLAAAHYNYWVRPIEEEQPLAEPLLSVEPERLLRMMEYRLHLLELERSALIDIPHLSFVYESDLADPRQWERTTHTVWEALGLKDVPVRSAIGKTWNTPYAEMYENYHELTAAVRRSHLAAYAPAADGAG